MEKKKTNTKILSEEAKEFLYSIDDYAKGNIKDYNTKIVTLECTEEDLKFSLGEGVVFRQFFKVNNKEISVPAFFTVVEGVCDDIGEYLNLFNNCINSDNTLFIESVADLFNKEFNSDTKLNKLKNVIGTVVNLAEIKYSRFYVRSENKFHINGLINSRDKNLSKYPVDLQRYLLEKLNYYINFNIFSRRIDDGEKFKLLELISNLNNDLIEKINNFDISKPSPKITLFLSDDKTLTSIETLFLGYLHSLGMDIIVFTPGGAANLDLVLHINTFSKLKLHRINTRVKYKLLKNINKYIYKYRLTAEKISGALSSLGYNDTVRSYRRSLKKVKHPILNKISNYISGWGLLGISVIGTLVNSLFIIFNVFANSQLLPMLGIISFILSITFILGIAVLSLEI